MPGRMGFRSGGFAPRVVYERPVEADALDQQHARTSVWRRKWFKVPEGPWPCEVCSEYLVTGTWAHRRIVRGEAFYRHPRCAPSVGPGGPT